MQGLLRAGSLISAVEVASASPHNRRFVGPTDPMLGPFDIGEPGFLHHGGDSVDPGLINPPRLPGIELLDDDKPPSGSEDAASFGYPGLLISPVVHRVDRPDGREPAVLEGEVMGGSLDKAYVG